MGSQYYILCQVCWGSIFKRKEKTHTYLSMWNLDGLERRKVASPSIGLFCQEDTPLIGLSLTRRGAHAHVEAISDGSQHHMPLVKYHPLRQWRKALYSLPHPISCNFCEVTESGERVTLPGLDLSPSGNQNEMPGAATTAFICLPHSRKFITHRVILSQCKSPTSIGRRKKEWEVSSAWNPLQDASICYHIRYKNALGWLPRLLVIWPRPASFSPSAKLVSQIPEQTLLCLSWNCCSSLLSFQGAAQVSNLIEDFRIPPAHTTVSSLLTLTVLSVTSNLEPNYVLGCILLCVMC